MQRRNIQIGTLLWLFFFALSLVPGSALAQTAQVHVSAPSRSLSWFPAHLTREKGFYRAEGLDVDFVLMKPQLALQALITGDVGYTTALGSTLRAAIRGLPLRVVMTIADKPLFALVARTGINSVEELKGKLIGISSFGASSDTLGRAILRRYRLDPSRDVKILALGGGTNRVVAMRTGAIDAALIEAPYNVLLEREGFHKLLFVGDLIPSGTCRLRNEGGKNPQAARRGAAVDTRYTTGNSIRQEQQTGKRKGDHKMGRYGSGSGGGKL
jgi:ABC-type nitrate/sulfonate/bicarbonate transport system substrate-binding protein